MVIPDINCDLVSRNDKAMRDISDNVSVNIIIYVIIPLIVYKYQSDYLSSSSVVVLSQLPSAVRVRQDVLVSVVVAPRPPQTFLPSWLW